MICGLIFLFLIAPMLVVIPLSFNAEPYFTFTEKMLAFDPAGYSLRWYDMLLTFGHADAEGPRDWAWWAEPGASRPGSRWRRTRSSSASSRRSSRRSWARSRRSGLSRPEMPFRRAVMAVLISPMIVPLIITATGLFFFYSATGLAGSYTGIILAHATLGIPFVIITVTATLVGFDHSLTRAAASPRGVARHDRSSRSPCR